MCSHFRNISQEWPCLNNPGALSHWLGAARGKHRSLQMWLRVSEGKQLGPSICALPEIEGLGSLLSWPLLYTCSKNYKGNEYLAEVLETQPCHNC